MTHRWTVLAWLLVVGVVLSACSAVSSVPAAANNPAEGASAAARSPWPDAATAADRPSAHPSERDYRDLIVREMHRRANEPRPVERSALPPRHLDVDTFPVSLVDRNRIVLGGPPPDGIAPIDDPNFERADTVDWLAADEAVIAVRVGDTVRGYPVQILIWHEIVNDTIDGVPAAVTYCPLCNSAVVFDRRHEGQTLDFGTSGAVYQSALVMYDRQTESLWTHFDGRSVVGDLVGGRLERLSASTVSWEQFRSAHPTAEVLSRDTGRSRPYGRNPYGAYDQRDAPLTGFFSGNVDAREAAMERVVGVTAAEPVAVRSAHLAEVGVIETTVAGTPLTLWSAPGLASSLNDDTVAGGDHIGASGVFVAEHGGRTLSFARDGHRFVDAQTGSTWNILGEAVAGPLAGATLESVPHVDSFWFAWSTYQPETTLVE